MSALGCNFGGTGDRERPRMEKPGRVQEGVVVVVRRGERLLLIRRAPDILAGGAWCFVGGAIEPGETQQQAVIREFREEVDGCVRPLRKVWEYARPDGGLILHWWLAELEDGELSPNPTEVAELRWCRVDEIEHMPGLLESNRRFLRVWGPGIDGPGSD